MKAISHLDGLSRAPSGGRSKGPIAFMRNDRARKRRRDNALYEVDGSGSIRGLALTGRTVFVAYMPRGDFRSKRNFDSPSFLFQDLYIFRAFTLKMFVNTNRISTKNAFKSHTVIMFNVNDHNGYHIDNRKFVAASQSQWSLI